MDTMNLVDQQKGTVATVAPAAVEVSAPPAAPAGPPAAMLAYCTPMQDFVHSADAKAAVVLTLLGIMFTLLARFGSPLEASLRGPGFGFLRVVSLLLLAGFCGAALAAVVFAFRTISPRFPKAPPSLAFFGDIAALPREQYVSRVVAMNAAQAMDEMLSYKHTGARVVVLKFRQLRPCLRSFETAAVCWLLLMGCLGAKALA